MMKTVSLLLQQVEGLLRSEGVAGLLGVLRELERCRGFDVAAVGSDAEGVGACLGEPLTARLA